MSTAHQAPSLLTLRGLRDAVAAYADDTAKARAFSMLRFDVPRERAMFDALAAVQGDDDGPGLTRLAQTAIDYAALYGQPFYQPYHTKAESMVFEAVDRLRQEVVG